MLSSKIQIFELLLDKPGSKRARLILFFALIGLINSCDFINKNKQNENLSVKKIAKVFDRDIYADEIEVYIKKDSSLIVNNYLNEVAIKEALFLTAQESDLINKEEIELQTERFRKSLISAYFEKEYIKQNLDTNIKEDDLKQFYNINASQLVLNSSIFKGIYVVLPSNSNKINRLKELMLSAKPENTQEVRNICIRYSNSFSVECIKWIELPIQIERLFSFNQETVFQAINNKQLITFEKDDNLYLFRFFDFKFANQLSPYTFNKDKIGHQILEKRKEDLLLKLKQKLLTESKANNKIKIY